MKSVTAKCIFCGAGITPVAVEGGKWERWGCIKCGSMRAALVDFPEGAVIEYICGPEEKKTKDRLFFCPVECLFVAASESPA